MTRPYHLTPGASQGNAFTAHLDGTPSVFAGDRAHTPQGKDGKSLQEKAVARHLREGATLVDPVTMQRRGSLTLAQKESTPDAMARRGKLVRAAI